MGGEKRTGRKFERGYRADGKALRSRRARAHLSLKELASRAGVNYTTINRIEHGHNRSPHWSTLEQLADALGVDVEELVVFLDDEPVGEMIVFLDDEPAANGEAVTDEKSAENYR